MKDVCELLGTLARLGVGLSASGNDLARARELAGLATRFLHQTNNVGECTSAEAEAVSRCARLPLLQRLATPRNCAIMPPGRVQAVKQAASAILTAAALCGRLPPPSTRDKPPPLKLPWHTSRWLPVTYWAAAVGWRYA